MVRPGLLTYGCYPGKERGGPDLQPAMQLKTRVAAVVRHKRGDSISYGRTWTAPRDCTLAVVPIGYADGLHRCLSNRMEMLLHATRVRQVGRICMDMCMVDISNIPAKEGDTVTVFGKDISVSQFAKQTNRTEYEILTGVSQRVKRIFVRK